MRPSALLLSSLLALPGSAAVAAPASAPPLRVCADPNNLPYSNRREEGFENALASLLAKDLGRPLEYVWMPQRRGYIRRGLNAGLCDLVMGVPTALDLLRTTHPYYRSTYVFVRPKAMEPLRSLASPRLRGLRIGIPVVGDDGANPPPAQALADRGLARNVRGYSVYGDYAKDSPLGALVEAVRTNEVDVALAWGPVGGYFASHAKPALAVEPLPESEAPGGMTFEFDISAGVRKQDSALAADVDRVLARRGREVERLLEKYRVPLVARPASAASRR